MGDKTINYFEFPNREPDWAKLKQLFKRNISKYNVPFFEANSEIEREFLRFCETSNIPTHKKTIVEYDGKPTELERFLYLVLKDDDGDCVAEDQTRFLDLSTACPGGGAFGTCGRGAKQIDKVSVAAECVEQVTKLGFLSTRHPNVPRVYLLSTAVADALRAAGATGAEIVPTDAPYCYQLRITAETTGPARIGQTRMGKRCAICGTAKLFFGSSERCFHPSDLKPVDFQNCRSYQADNVGQFEILNGFPIVSQRMFNLLLGLKIKGLGRYSTDPPIQHAVVQICNL